MTEFIFFLLNSFEFTYWSMDFGPTAVARTPTPDVGNRQSASVAEAVEDTNPPPVPIPRASVGLVPCDGGWRASATYDGGADQTPPDPSLRPNGSHPMASHSTLLTLLTLQYTLGVKT